MLVKFFFFSFPENLFTPIFSNTLYTKRVLPYSRGVLKGIAAFDQDRAECTFRKTAACPCSKVVYGIIKGEHSERFQINPGTGELAYAADDIGYETEFKATIVARNIDEFGNLNRSSRYTGYANVRIIVTSDVEESETLLREILPYPNIYIWQQQEADDEEEIDHVGVGIEDNINKMGEKKSSLSSPEDWLKLKEGPMDHEKHHSRVKRVCLLTEILIM